MVPEIHSTSFALLVYASAWPSFILPVYAPRKYADGLLLSASLIQDARRHGVGSGHLVSGSCMALSDEKSLVRLGLRSVADLVQRHERNWLVRSSKGHSILQLT